MKNLNFLFAAYTAVWVLLFFYILSLARWNRSLAEEIEELRELIREGGDDPQGRDREVT